MALPVHGGCSAYHISLHIWSPCINAWFLASGTKGWQVRGRHVHVREEDSARLVEAEIAILEGITAQAAFGSAESSLMAEATLTVKCWGSSNVLLQANLQTHLRSRGFSTIRDDWR